MQRRKPRGENHRDKADAKRFSFSVETSPGSSVDSAWLPQWPGLWSPTNRETAAPFREAM